MSAVKDSPVGQWLNLAIEPGGEVYRMDFAERHIGNPMIRSLHGGAVGTMIEAVAEAALERQFAGDARKARFELTGSSIDYLRVTKDAPLYGRAVIVRTGRRIAFVDTWCWQDSEDLPVSRGTCQIRIYEED